MVKRILALLVSLTVAAGLMAGCSGRKQTQTASSGSTAKSPLSIYAAAQDVAKPSDQTWLWAYLSKKLNLDLKIQQVPWTSKEDQKKLLFASGDLPDVMYNFQLTNAEIMKYGESEKQILALNNYITAKNAPDITKWYAKMPAAKAACTTPSNNMYTVSCISAADPGGLYKVFVNTKWLDAVGMKAPTTLDEFTAVLRAFKEKNPGNVSKDKLVPAGGFAGADDIRGFVLNALGFLVNNCRIEHTTDPVMKDGEVVIPAADKLYLTYLTTLNTYYKEGLISPDYFTMDYKASRAQCASGNNGFYPQYGITTISTDYNFVKNWVALKPLTSSTNKTPQWIAPAQLATGNYVVSAKSKNIDAAIRFANWFFTDEAAVYQTSGPMKGSADTLGMLTGWEMGSDYKVVQNCKQTDLYCGYVCIGNNIGSVDGKYTTEQLEQKMAGLTTREAVIDKTTSAGWVQATVKENVEPYLKAGFPSTVYYSEEVSSAMTDLQTVIKTYVNAETAKFITGKRPLSEFDAFEAELKNMGIVKLQTYYKDAYATYQKSLKK